MTTKPLQVRRAEEGVVECQCALCDDLVEVRVFPKRIMWAHGDCGSYLRPRERAEVRRLLRAERESRTKKGRR